MSENQVTYYTLAVSLAAGLLIGVERGWRERDARPGERIAGVRTYGLIGLTGGGIGLIAGEVGSLLLGLAFIALAGTMTAVYVANLSRGREDVGITSLIAALLTFVLGALATTGHAGVAASAAVVTTLLLGYKPVLHGWVSALRGEELRAGLKLLLISVVLLPVLPNRGYGPWQALNPYAIWWMVVLIAAISFAGYFAIRIGGTRKGVLFTGLFGGLASSTALTLHFSRLARHRRTLAPVLSLGIILACGTMFPRMVLVASLFSPALFRPLVVPAALMTLLALLPALAQWRSGDSRQAAEESPLTNPLELKAALTFGALLSVIMLLGKALQQWVGDAGVLVLAAASGVADVDAITLSLAQMSTGELAIAVAATGAVIAAAVNTTVKATMACAIGGRAMWLRVGAPLVASAAGGVLCAWWWIW